MNFNSSNKTTESSLDIMAQRRTAFLNSGKPSKYEAGIISEAICPASTDEKLPDFLNTDASLAIPDNPIDLNNYMAVQSGAVELGKELLKKLKVQSKLYNQILLKTQAHAENTLEAGLKYGELLKQLPTQQGKRTDLEEPVNANVAMSKKEILAALGISERVASDLQKLTRTAIDKAKKVARDNGEIVTRKMALDYIREEHICEH